MTKPAPPSPEQFATFMDQFRAALVPAVQRMGEQLAAMHEAFKPLIELALEQPELFGIPDPELELGSCHCLCGRHPARRGVCTSYAERGLTVRFDSPTVGVQHVPMCRPCHDAHHGLPDTPRLSGMGELEAVTDTCACHCWQNHPEVQGVCEAGSVDGVQIDGKPACFECATAATQN